MISNNFSKQSKQNNLRLVFESNSHEIFEYLEKADLNKLKLTNKFFYELCECNLLLTDSIRSLDKIFVNSLLISNSQENTKSSKDKKSKFKEKFLFNKSLNSFMKGKEVETYSNKRLQSAKRKKNDKK